MAVIFCEGIIYAGASQPFFGFAIDTLPWVQNNFAAPLTTINKEILVKLDAPQKCCHPMMPGHTRPVEDR